MGLKTATPETDSERQQCLSGNLGWLLSQAHWALATEMGAALAPLGISGRAYHVLRAALSGEHTQTQLADMVGLDKTTMVVTIDDLERAGLAERRASEEDRRVRVIGVTSAGRRKLAEADAVKEKIQNDVLEALPARERQVLLDALAHLVSTRLSQSVECTPPLRRREPRV
jgi:DNA-binding MarR family transcriptional regulator